jgi:hypothetical protein
VEKQPEHRSIWLGSDSGADRPQHAGSVICTLAVLTVRMNIAVREAVKTTRPTG